MFVDAEHFESFLGDFYGDMSAGLHFGEVSYTPYDSVGDAGGAAASLGEELGGVWVDVDVKYFSAAQEDLFQLVGGVEVQFFQDTEAGSEGGGEEAFSGGSADEGKGGEMDGDGAGVGTLVEHHIDTEVLHSGVEVFFDDGLESMDFIDEEDIAFLQGS